MRAAARTTFATNTDTNRLPTRDFRITTGIIDQASTPAPGTHSSLPNGTNAGVTGRAIANTWARFG